MAIEIIRNSLQIDQIAGDEGSQILVESDIIVPEGNPDMGRILDVSGRIYINSKEVIQDKVMVEGAVVYNVLYLAESDDRHIASMEVDTSFTNYIDIPDVEPKMTAKISANLEHINWDIINSRKLNVGSLMNVSVKVFELVQLDAVDNITGDSHVEMLRESIALSYESGQGEAQTIVRESLELSDNMPTIVEILRKDIGIRDLDHKASDNKVVVSGIMDIGFLYRCEDPDYPIHHFVQEIEFAHVVDISGAYQNMDCRCDVEVDDLYIAPKEDLNGDLRLAEVEVLMLIKAATVERQYRDILLDAYMPGGAISLETECVNIVEFRGEGESSVSLKESVALSENMPRIDTVLYVDAKASITDKQLYDGYLLVDGVVSANILYQSRDSGGISSLKQDIPFSQDISIEGIDQEMNCEGSIRIGRTGFTLLASDEVELNIVLDIGAQVFEEIKINAIIGLEEEELPLKQTSGIFVYFTRPGDDLWYIAKRYNTTRENILKFNTDLEEDIFDVGSRVIVYKKYDYRRDEMSV